MQFPPRCFNVSLSDWLDRLFLFKKGAENFLFWLLLLRWQEHSHLQTSGRCDCLRGLQMCVLMRLVLLFVYYLLQMNRTSTQTIDKLDQDRKYLIGILLIR